MSRPKLIPDAEVYATVFRLLQDGGDKAVAFASVGRSCGLAASTLVQRFGSREAMVQAALNRQWQQAEAALARAECTRTPKGAQQLLKVLPDVVPLVVLCLRYPALRGRAEAWRASVLLQLTVCLGGGAKAAEAAAMLFSVWQGQALWKDAGDKGFRLKDVVRRLGRE